VIIVVGLVGFEPAAFARKQRWAVPTGFFTAPELLHPSLVRKPVYLLSGARRHTVPAAIMRCAVARLQPLPTLSFQNFSIYTLRL